MTAGRSTPILINQKNIIIPHIGNSQSHLVFRLVIRQVKVDFHFLRFADAKNCAQSSKNDCQTKSFHCLNYLILSVFLFEFQYTPILNGLFLFYKNPRPPNPGIQPFPLHAY